MPHARTVLLLRRASTLALAFGEAALAGSPRCGKTQQLSFQGTNEASGEVSPDGPSAEARPRPVPRGHGRVWALAWTLCSRTAADLLSGC